MIEIEEFGKRLQSARASIGISQSELARRCELSSAMISSLESKKKFPSLETALKICDALGITLDHLIYGKWMCDPENVKLVQNIWLAQFGELDKLTQKDQQLIINLVRRLRK